MKYEKIFLSNEEYFKLSIGKRKLKKELKELNGNIPLYSANVFEPFGYVSISNIDDFSFPAILWGIDGNFELNYLKPNIQFATTDHCGTIHILNEKIVPQYILYSLYILKEDLSFDRNFRASLFNMKTISINVPIDSNGEFNVEKQYEYIKKYQAILMKKGELKNQLTELVNADISIPYSFDEFLDEYKELYVRDIFDLSHTTNGSFLTKSFVRANQGDIPVYGASKFEDYIGYGYIKDNLEKVKYFSNCLTWNIDGSIGIFYRNGKFSLSEKVIPLIVKLEYDKLLNRSYLRYAILSEVMKNPFSFTNKGNKTRLGDILIKIPTFKDKINLKEQAVISKYCEEIDVKNDTLRLLKNDIVSSVEKIINKQVILDGVI